MLPLSASRNFSRPFPSPQFINDVGTPVRSSSHQHGLAGLPSSTLHLGVENRVSPADTSDPSEYPRVDSALGHSHEYVSTQKPHLKPYPYPLSLDQITQCVNPDSEDQIDMARSRSADGNSCVKSQLNNLHRHHTTCTPDKPIINFRFALWRYLDKTSTCLNLDLFWPIDLTEEKNTKSSTTSSSPSSNDDDDPESDHDKSIFPYIQLRSLVEFHNLEYLQLHGMMRSYQPLIWATCWANPNLKTLRLEMALEPIIYPDRVRKCVTIDHNWKYGEQQQYHNLHLASVLSEKAEDKDYGNEYLGAYGTGIVHEEFGEGEYLDHFSIAFARDQVHLNDIQNLSDTKRSTASSSSSPRYLSITRLALRNFVVDGAPFTKWFDLDKLHEIRFLGRNCLDVGFSLSGKGAEKVKIVYDDDDDNNDNDDDRDGHGTGSLSAVTARRITRGEIKMVEIGKRNNKPRVK